MLGCTHDKVREWFRVQGIMGRRLAYMLLDFVEYQGRRGELEVQIESVLRFFVEVRFILSLSVQSPSTTGLLNNYCTVTSSSYI